MTKRCEIDRAMAAQNIEELAEDMAVALETAAHDIRDHVQCYGRDRDRWERAAQLIIGEAATVQRRLDIQQMARLLGEYAGAEAVLAELTKGEE